MSASCINLSDPWDYSDGGGAGGSHFDANRAMDRQSSGGPGSGGTGGTAGQSGYDSNTAKDTPESNADIVEPSGGFGDTHDSTVIAEGDGAEEAEVGSGQDFDAPGIGTGGTPGDLDAGAGGAGGMSSRGSTGHELPP